MKYRLCLFFHFFSSQFVGRLFSKLEICGDLSQGQNLIDDDIRCLLIQSENRRKSGSQQPQIAARQGLLTTYVERKKIVSKDAALVVIACRNSGRRCAEGRLSATLVDGKLMKGELTSSF
ncbi:MAG: hypothetical protein Q8J78_11370 [Moraxellaceae bacterium]|nr:hypothetical protein [Moraxellaceae bacterium]